MTDVIWPNKGRIAHALLDRPAAGDSLPAVWAIVQACEAADWAQLVPLASALAIETDVLAARYTEAVTWADSVCHY